MISFKVFGLYDDVSGDACVGTCIFHVHITNTYVMYEYVYLYETRSFLYMILLSCMRAGEQVYFIFCLKDNGVGLG